MSTGTWRIIDASKPFWEMDAESLARANKSFEVHAVVSDEQKQSVLEIAVRHRLLVERGESFVRLSPPKGSKPGPGVEEV